MTEPIRKQSITITGKVLESSEQQDGVFRYVVQVNDQEYVILSHGDLYQVDDHIENVPLNCHTIPANFIGFVNKAT